MLRFSGDAAALRHSLFCKEVQALCRTLLGLSLVFYHPGFPLDKVTRLKLYFQAQTGHSESCTKSDVQVGPELHLYGYYPAHIWKKVTGYLLPQTF